MAKLSIEIDARPTLAAAKQVRDALRGIGEEAERAGKATDDAFGGRRGGPLRNVPRRTRRAAQGFGELTRSIRAAAGAFTAFMGARGAGGLIDASVRIRNSLAVAGLEGEQLASTLDQISDIAAQNRAPLESLAQVYGAASLAANELGASNQELIGLTESVSLALRISGRGAAESSGAILQLSQALGSGVVRAEEFNSILEGMPSLARAAAFGLSEAENSTAKLRQMMLDGEITSEAFFRAIQAGTPYLERLARNTVPTMSQSITTLANSLIIASGKFNEGTSASQAFAGGIDTLAESIRNSDFSGFIDDISELVGWLRTGTETLMRWRDATNEAAAEFGRRTGLNQVGPFLERQGLLPPGLESGPRARLNQIFNDGGGDLTADIIRDFASPNVKQSRIQVPIPSERPGRPVSIEDFRPVTIAANDLGRSLSGVSSGYSDASREARRFRDSQTDGTRTMEGFTSAAEGFASTLISGFTSGADATDTLRSALQQLANTLLSNAFSGQGGGLLSILTRGFGGGFGAITGGGAQVAAATAGAVGLFAQGGAFTNGIVTRPTLFPMANGAGLMGEAGPEAVMPLARGRDGSLGVRASGGGSVVNNIYVSLAGANGNQEVADIATRAVGAAVLELQKSQTGRTAVAVQDGRARGILRDRRGF